jgi:hypothetical protein
MDVRIAFLIFVSALITVNSFQPLGSFRSNQRDTCAKLRSKPVPRSVGVLCSIAKPTGPGTPIRSPSFLNTEGECAYTRITLTRYMRDVSRENPELRDLEDLISGIQQVELNFVEIELPIFPLDGLVLHSLCLIFLHDDSNSYSRWNLWDVTGMQGYSQPRGQSMHYWHDRL